MAENDEGEVVEVQVHGKHWLQWIEDSDSFEDINLEEVVPNEFEDGCDDIDSVQHIPSAKVKVAKLVAFMDKMKPACDDVMRSTRVHRVLQCFGQVFWARDQDFFHLSDLTKDFDEFVSRSWHVKAWKKALLLMILKNGMPAVVAGFLAAFLMAFLWQLDFLPTYITSANTSSISCWCLTAGLLMTLMILLFWRAKGSVFLDRICINQKDLRRKTQGVMSIGAILKASHSILVIFDETYVDRLWCVFEIAAFLKAHPDLSGPEKLMKVQPVLLGFASFSVAIACSLTGFVALFSVKLGLWFSWILTFAVLGLEGNFLISAFRSYFRTLEESTHRLQEFQVHKAVCWCCSVNHLDPVTQNEIDVCDREVVQMCVSSWFGSTTNFEVTVRSQVAEALKHQVGSDAFPYGWILGSSAPLMWMLLDLIASYQKDETLHFMVPFWIIRGFAWWLWGVPTIATIGLFGARRLRAKGSSLLAENCRNLLVVVGASPIVVVLVLWQIITEVLFHRKDDTLGSLIFALGVLILFLIIRLAYHRSIRIGLEVANKATRET